MIEGREANGEPGGCWITSQKPGEDPPGLGHTTRCCMTAMRKMRRAEEMVRTCTVCTHKALDEINRLLLSGEPYRSIAKQFKISDSAVFRHKESHIPEILSKSNDIKEILTADSLVQRVEEEAEFVREMRDAAKAEGDIELALKAVDRALKCVDLYAKVQGIIKDQPTVNITLNAEWIALRTTIVQALEPFPDARRVVIDALP